jgi:hypothetical protein
MTQEQQQSGRLAILAVTPPTAADDAVAAAAGAHARGVVMHWGTRPANLHTRRLHASAHPLAAAAAATSTGPAAFLQLLALSVF